MIEKRGVLIKVVLASIFLIAIAHSFYSLKQTVNPSPISGNAVYDEIKNQVLTDKNKLILAAEWTLIILISLYLFIKHKFDVKKEMAVMQRIKVPSRHGKTSLSKTDLDVLYDILKEKKKVPTSLLMKYFQVNQKVILYWGNVLEEANIATVRYPALGEPVITLNEVKLDEKEKP